MIDTLLFLGWLVGIFGTIGLCGFLEGRAKRRFEGDKSVQSYPPYIALMFAAPAWPLLLLGVGGWWTWVWSRGLGDKQGARVNEDVHRMRQLEHDYGENFVKIMEQLASGKPFSALAPMLTAREKADLPGKAVIKHVAGSTRNALNQLQEIKARGTQCSGVLIDKELLGAEEDLSFTSLGDAIAALQNRLDTAVDLVKKPKHERLLQL